MGLARAESVAARAIAGLPEPVRRGLAGRPFHVDGATMDSQAQLILALRERMGAPPLDALTPAEARDLLRRDATTVAGPGPPVATHELTVDGATGPLRARHYRPPPGEPGPRPLLVYLHGGGHVSGDIDTHDVPCRSLCLHAGVHVVSVDYRRAPEHPFPAAVDDTVAAVRWAYAHAATLGADADRIAVGGDSAGGNLATVACQLLARAGERAPAAQLLVYPTTDRVGTYPSATSFAQGCYLTDADIDWYLTQYVGTTGHPLDDPRISPLLADNLTGLPPAVVVTAGFDPLRDEGEAYAHALRAAGTPTTLRRFPTLVHGFLCMAGGSRAARDATVEIAGTLRATLDLHSG
ncbi:MAG: alpha/beta hydrolase fold domain-containing protein [Streptosporangiales bacterium]|nr:alpha/beta hydrolase fold domain-containing protein [Streptosporangiales bacterium]